MGRKRAYRKYATEFKEEAVALILYQGYSVPEASKSLRIANNMLYRWKEQIELQQEGNKVMTWPLIY